MLKVKYTKITIHLLEVCDSRICQILQMKNDEIFFLIGSKKLRAIYSVI
jgi:hypothetical protein